jgi:hypothetical protein
MTRTPNSPHKPRMPDSALKTLQDEEHGEQTGSRYARDFASDFGLKDRRTLELSSHLITLLKNAIVDFLATLVTTQTDYRLQSENPTSGFGLGLITQAATTLTRTAISQT